MFLRYIIFFLCATAIQLNAVSQADSVNQKAISWSAYVETYYLYDFGNPSTNNRPDFFYSFTRHNELNLNLGAIQVQYNKERVKAKLGLMTGTYAKANLAQEPAIYRMILNANIGYQLFKNSNTWFTVGVFPSHLGFESAIGANCWNMTRSLVAENSPYFLAGAKVYHTSANEKWTIGITATNGWQRIQRQVGNSAMGLGHQLQYKPSKKLTFNSSSFVGSDYPDAERRMRYFHNFYMIAHLSSRFSIITGVDAGIEQTAKGTSAYNNWFAPVLLAKYQLTDKIRIAGRVEYYVDENEVIIRTTDNGGFATTGFSLNADFALTDVLLWRVEGRLLADKRSIYTVGNNPSNTNSFLGTSLSIKIN